MFRCRPADEAPLRPQSPQKGPHQLAPMHGALAAPQHWFADPVPPSRCLLPSPQGRPRQPVLQLCSVSAPRACRRRTSLL
eukprot:1623310-Alexandrium_andersonii.AAC.1